MTAPDASSGEMPRVPMPGRAGRDQDEQLLLDMILDRRPLPPDAPPGMLVLADKLVGLAAPPRSGELPGEAAALAAFIRSGSPASTLTLAGGPSERRRPRRFTAGRGRLSAAAAALVVGLSGTAAAAYAGVLPATVQNFAHRMIDAPAAHHAAHGHGGFQQPGAGHPGGAPSSPQAGRSAHPAKPGQQKAHKRGGHRGHQVISQRKPKPTHLAHPSPTPRAHPSHSPSPPTPSGSPTPRVR